MKYYFFILIILFSISCSTIDEPIEEFELGIVSIDESHLIIINFPFINSDNLNSIFNDATTLQILSFYSDGKRIKSTICMCGLPEPQEMILQNDSKIEYLPAIITINENQGVMTIHSGIRDNLNPREYKFPISSKMIDIIYKIRISDGNYIGPYRARFEIE